MVEHLPAENLALTRYFGSEYWKSAVTSEHLDFIPFLCPFHSGLFFSNVAE